MSDNKVKHLEFIQAVIARLNSNSFQVKGWAVTITAGLYALAANGANFRFVWVTFIPIFSLWVVNAHFNMYERRFRDLYANAIVQEGVDFSMEVRSDVRRLWSSFISDTLAWFYFPMFLTSAIVTLIGLTD
jgi:hypothetical protein